MVGEGTMYSLKGKKALVTGGAGELGFAFAEVLQEYGAQVTLLDVSEKTGQMAQKLCSSEMPVYSVQADLSNKEQMGQAFDQAVKLMGGLDILVNAVGIQRRCRAEDFAEKDWEDVININLTTSFYLSQKSARIMLNAGGGKIINIASMSSFFGMKFIPAYVASKGGVMQLTKALSNEWAEKGIQVNAIAPGFMMTKMNAAYFEESCRDLYEGITKRIPTGRWGKPDDLKGALIFLASSASDYVSGITLPVDGGYVGR